MSRYLFTEFTADTMIERFEKAMNALRSDPGSTLVIPAGDYVITSERARETMEKAINGVYGENPQDVMFCPDYAFTEGIRFHGVKNAVIEANGARLLVDGFMEPLAMKECENIRVEGLTIDYLRKPFSMGIVESFRKLENEDRAAEITVRFDDRYPVNENTIMPRVSAYDLQNRYFHIGFRVAERKYLGDQRFVIRLARMPEIDLTGMEFYIWHSFHFRPAILIESAKDITLENVTIHAQPGMGLIGHRSENILLKGFRVVPSEGTHMSTNTDATHFTSCRGELRFENCEFDGQGDDSTNVHGYYHNFEIIDAERRMVRAKLNSLTASLTMDYADKGDTLELHEEKSCLTVDTFRVLDAVPDFETGSCTLTLDHPVPEGSEARFLSDISQMPKLFFVNCTCNNHWARCVLIKTRHVLVSGCTFRACALWAVQVAAESDWLESSAPADVTITNNRFILCGAPARTKLGGVRVNMTVEQPEGTPIDGIVISENTFDLPNAEIAVSVSNAKNVRIENNRIRTASDAPVRIDECDAVRISGNCVLTDN